MQYNTTSSFRRQLLPTSFSQVRPNMSTFTRASCNAPTIYRLIFLLFLLWGRQGLFLPTKRYRNIQLPTNTRSKSSNKTLRTRSTNNIRLICRPQTTVLFRMRRFLLQGTNSIIRQAIQTTKRVPSNESFFLCLPITRLCRQHMPT